VRRREGFYDEGRVVNVYRWKDALVGNLHRTRGAWCFGIFSFQMKRFLDSLDEIIPRDIIFPYLELMN
jgi:hypothetical protein